jgi:hypothetical protein
MAQGPMMMPPPAAPADPGQFAQYRTQMRESPEDIWQPVYDRKNYPAAGAFELIFFSIPVGGSDTLIRAGTAASVTKTRRDTNLEQQGVIPTKAFKIHGFSLCFVPVQQAVSATALGGTGSTPSIIDDMQRLMYGGFLEFRIVDKPYLYLPLHKIPATGILRGVAAFAATGALSAVSAGGPGTGAPRDIYWIGIPLVLDPYQNFSARLQFDGSPALNQTFDIQLFMEGYLRRPGQ